jgi:type II secretion system protein L
MQYLIINIKALESDSLDYAILENETITASLTQSTWKKVIPKARGKKVIVTIPTEQVFLGSANIPSRNKKQLKQAIPFALEDYLIEEVDTQHFVFHSAKQNNTHVGVINQIVLQQWIKLLKRKKLYGATLLPDVFLLKQQAGAWTLSVQGERALLRTGIFSGFSCSTDILPTLLKYQFEDTPEAEQINCLLNYSNASLALELPEDLSIEAYPNESMVFAKDIIAALPLNLNQGIVVKGGLSKQINWKYWRISTALLVTCILSYMLFLGIQSKRLEQENNHLLAQSKQIFLQTFKDRKRVVNPRVEMQAALTKLRKSSGKIESMYMEILHRVGQLINQDKQIKIKLIRYRQGELSLSLMANNVSQLEKLNKKMTSISPMYQVQLRSIASGNSQVTAKLIVKEKS